MNATAALKPAVKPAKAPAGTSLDDGDAMVVEIDKLIAMLSLSLRTSVECALMIGLRLLILHRTNDNPGGFRAALACVEGHRIPPSTAYRWANAASNVLARVQNITDHKGDYHADDLSVPAPGTPAFAAAEKSMVEYAAGTSMRRLLIGSSSDSEESRMDKLIASEESGDPLATAILEKIASGEITLVQAIRAHAGQVATKGKHRNDPVYLDIDGSTGQPTGLFPKCLITLSNTFDRWDNLDETARGAAKSAWKALVSKLPRDLR